MNLSILDRELMLPKIVKAPASVLSRPTLPIEDIDSSIAKLSKTMGLVLRASKIGAALAANQIGYSKSMFVWLDDNGKLLTAINPIITFQSGEVTENEACLSIPGKNFKVTRPQFVDMTYVDLEGNTKTKGAKDFTARLFMHEIDHLEGKLINGG